MQARICPELNTCQLRHLSHKFVGVQKVEHRIRILRKAVPMVQRLLNLNGIVVDRPCRTIKSGKLVRYRASYIVVEKIVNYNIAKRFTLIKCRDQRLKVDVFPQKGFLRSELRVNSRVF